MHLLYCTVYALILELFEVCYLSPYNTHIIAKLSKVATSHKNAVTTVLFIFRWNNTTMAGAIRRPPQVRTIIVVGERCRP